MHSVEHRIGKLLEIRFSSPLDRDEVEAFAIAAREKAAEMGDRVVACVDMRALRPLSPEVTEAFVEVLRATNPRVVRTACLLPEGNATLMLQIERLHREAGNPARRTFRDAGELDRWLAEALGRAEQERLRTFLGR